MVLLCGARVPRSAEIDVTTPNGGWEMNRGFVGEARALWSRVECGGRCGVEEVAGQSGGCNWLWERWKCGGDGCHEGFRVQRCNRY
ncbi:hypothetical protein BD779DRAFT_754687 [Infundibulicybe gibba]|nr:hypothetical protein BD779DRAFT_754687 [Infundibulicybe gibba]